MSDKIKDSADGAQLAAQRALGVAATQKQILEEKEARVKKLETKLLSRNLTSR